MDPRPPTLRRLEPAERDAAVQVLSAAFADYPVMRYVLGGDPADDPEGLAALVGFFTDVRYEMGWPVLGLEVDGELVAASLVNEPTDAPFLERFAEPLARLRAALGHEAYARLEAFELASEGNEPDERHWFVGMVGVLPAHQRRGYGRLLLDHVHARAAADGCGVALSTEDVRNVPFYEALGYRVVGEVALDGLHTWGFWRPADGSEAAGAGRGLLTALHRVAEDDRVELAGALLDAGADLEARAPWGATPFDWAATMGSGRVARLLLARGASGLTLVTAAALGMADQVEAALADDPTRHRRRDAPTEPDDHWPADSAHIQGDVLSDALYAAARNGHASVAARLLDRGAAVDARGVFGGTGLHWAAIHGHADTVRLLLAAGADPALRDHRFDADAAGWAHEGGHVALAEELAAARAGGAVGDSRDGGADGPAE